MNKKGVKISSEIIALTAGFVIGFLLSFAVCWNTITYVVGIVLEK